MIAHSISLSCYILCISPKVSLSYLISICCYEFSYYNFPYYYYLFYNMYISMYYITIECICIYKVRLEALSACEIVGASFASTVSKRKALGLAVEKEEKEEKEGKGEKGEEIVVFSGPTLNDCISLIIPHITGIFH